MTVPRALIFALASAFVAVAAPTFGEDLAFMLINRTSVDLTGFYVSPSNTNSWDEDLLAETFLPAGFEVRVDIRDGLDVCDYDIRGVFADGEVVEDYKLDLCDLGSYTFTE